MNTQKRITTNLTNEIDQPIKLRLCSQPIEAVAKIYETIKCEHKPFTQKTSKLQPKLKK